MEEIPLRKKSHIILAKYLNDEILGAGALEGHRKAFCLGSILPDCQPAFIYRKHEYFGTIDIVRRKMDRLVLTSPDVLGGRVYLRRLGEVIHYMADYFTFPHNKTFGGNFNDHNRYEEELKNRLKTYIVSGEAKDNQEEIVEFRDVSEMMDFVAICHDSYLRKERTVEEDIRYITFMCSQVAWNITNLSCKNASVAQMAVATC